MSTRHHVAIRRLLALAMLLTSLAAIAPAGTAAQNDRGLIDDTSYQSPQFGYTVTWSDPWAVQDRDVITNPGGFDTITLRSDAGTLRISGRADTYNPLTFLQDTIAIQLASGGELINQDTTGAAPTAELQIGGDRMRLDVISLPEAGAIVLVSLRASTDQYEAAFASVQQSVQIQGNPAFGAATTAPATTAAPTEGAGTETPVATSTVEVLGSGIEGDTYTSPNFGFSVRWDPATWTVPEDAEYSEPGYDSLKLETDTGPIWVTGWEAYDGNPSSCLLGEQTYYNDPEAGISEYEVAVDANGNELTGSDEHSAWGVFTNVYTDPENPGAEPINYVDYINCVSMGDGKSVVIFYSFARRENYNDHIGKVIAVVDSLELPAAAATPPATPAPATETPTPTELPATQAPPTATETSTAAVGTPVVVGQTEVGWTGAWQYDASSSIEQQATLTQVDPATGTIKLATYGEFQDATVTNPGDALDTFAEAFFNGAGAENETPIGSGTLPDGTAWKTWSFSLQGLQLTFLATVRQASDGAWVVSTVTGNSDTFAETVALAQQEITLNGQPVFLAGVDPAAVLAQGTTLPPASPTAPATTPPATAAETQTPVATAGAETPVAGQTPVDIGAGDTVAGQTYAYSFTVPAGWSVTSSQLGGEIERTELTNGTSTVSIEARAMQAPTLSDCVANIAGEQQSQAIYADLELARTASGDPFSGEDQFSAFANFTFTGPDGATWAHFVECRWIEQGQSVLVVIQDVPQDQFGAQRPARRQIQNSIEIGS